MSSAPAAVFLLLLLLAAAAQAFYLPGVAPNEYADGDRVDVKAVKLTSTKRPLPYQYYYLPFCRPDKITNTRENLGEVLHGDRITNTPYDVHMNVNVSCQLLCRGDKFLEKSYNKKQVAQFERFITQQYRAHWSAANKGRRKEEKGRRRK